MAYTPTNNPYIPGDPYSYDLKWMVEEVKKAQAVGEEAAASAEAAAASAEQSGDWEADARLYAQNAETSAQNAADSAEAAAESEANAKNYADNIADPVGGIVTTWLNDNVTPVGSAVVVDESLSIAGAAADAKVAGDMIRSVDGRLTFSDWTNSFITADLGAPYTRSSDNNALSLNPSPAILDGMIGLTVICPVGYVAQIFYYDASLNVLARTDLNEINRLDVPENATGFNINIAKRLADAIATTDADNVIIIKETKAAMYENSLINILLSTTENHGCYDLDFTGGSLVQGITNPNGSGSVQASTTRCTDKILNEVVPPYRKARPTSLIINAPANIKYRVTFWNSGNPKPADLIVTDSNTNWQTKSIIDIPSTAVSYKFTWAFSDNSTITPADLAGISVNLRFGKLGQPITDEYVNKRISILGDSISTFAGSDAETASDGHLIANGIYTFAGNHCRYPNSYLSDVNNTYWKKLIDALGLTLGINDSWAGSRVSWDGSTGSDIGADIYIASPTRIGHLDDNGTPDIILVNAGTNDIGAGVTIGTFNTESPKNYTDAQIAALPVATFADAYRAMLIRLQKAYPLAKIVVMLPNYTTSYYNPEQADAYLEIIKEACDYFGVPWVDMRASGFNMFNTSTYTGDGIHPNTAGMQLLFEKVEKFMLFEL